MYKMMPLCQNVIPAMLYSAVCMAPKWLYAGLITWGSSRYMLNKTGCRPGESGPGNH